MVGKKKAVSQVDRVCAVISCDKEIANEEEVGPPLCVAHMLLRSISGKDHFFVINPELTTWKKGEKKRVAF